MVEPTDQAPLASPNPASAASNSQRRASDASSTARFALLAYALLIVYASWYPFSGWRDIGISAFAYLSAPLPHYWTWFDLLTNVVGYIPLGLLIACAVYPRLRGVWAGLLAALSGTALSAMMEAVQTFLPSRVASNLDLLTNASGACIGAVLGVLLTPYLLQDGRLLDLRRRWLLPAASHGLIVVILWPLAQLYPQEYLFGHGQLTPLLSQWLSNWLNNPIDLGEWMRLGLSLKVSQYWAAEASVTATGLAGVSLILLSQVRREAPQIRLWLFLVLGCLAIKSLASALLFAPENAFAWLTPGAEIGLLAGTIATLLALLCSLRWRRYLAIALLISSIYLVNAAPSNPYFIATLQTWVQGKFLNFEGAAQFLSLCWPLIALASLFTPMRAKKLG